MEKIIRIGLVDDHSLLRQALASQIDAFQNFKVVLQCRNGVEVIKKINEGIEIDVMLLDLNMPEMDGYETAIYFRQYFPSVHILMLTMYDSEIALIRLLQIGVKGFLKKDIHPNELKLAINTVIQTGYYYSTQTTGKLISYIKSGAESKIRSKQTYLNGQELEFLRRVCSDMTYKEIAVVMNMNPRSVDNLRDNLFNKLEVKSRVGLAMYSVKNGIVTV